MNYALVTGGSRGIGRAICLNFAKKGIPVIINYVSNDKAALETKATIEAEGGVAELLKFDTSSSTAINEALDQWEKEHPSDAITILVNNAGIRSDKLMLMMTEEDWHSVIDTSLNGFFYITRRVLRAMMRVKTGRIINMTSLSGLRGTPGQVNYSATKSAIIGATKALAQEMAKRGITVNAIAPGFIESDMTQDLNQTELVKSIPMGRFGRAEEVAELCSFLASDQAAYITGQCVSINGGLYT